MQKIQDFFRAKGWEYSYAEEDGLGSIDFLYRGVLYHIWEFDDGKERGVETNIRNGSGEEDITGNYSDAVIEILKNWH